MPEQWSPAEYERPRRVIPIQKGQLSLFPELTADIFAEARLRFDEAERWRELGWMSFDVTKFEELEENQIAELIFVRDIARSGLTESQVTALLSDLPKPYEYRSDHTAYSFSVGWVHCGPIDVRAAISESFSHWVNNKVSYLDWDTVNRCLLDVAKSAMKELDRRGVTPKEVELRDAALRGGSLDSNGE